MGGVGWGGGGGGANRSDKDDCACPQKRRQGHPHARRHPVSGRHHLQHKISHEISNNLFGETASTSRLTIRRIASVDIIPGLSGASML